MELSCNKISFTNYFICFSAKSSSVTEYLQRIKLPPLSGGLCYSNFKCLLTTD